MEIPAISGGSWALGGGRIEVDLKARSWKSSSSATGTASVSRGAPQQDGGRARKPPVEGHMSFEVLQASYDGVRSTWKRCSGGGGHGARR